MQLVARISGIAFGIIMISLSLAVTAETIIRKLFSVTLGGVDELSGYAIAIGAPLGFAVATIEQSHIRINLLYMKLPGRAQAVLNVAAAVSLGILAAYFLVFTVATVADTLDYRSLAQTPWATPLIYPQAVWLAVTAVFAGVAVLIAAWTLRLMLGRDWDRLAREFGPERVEDELEAELGDLERR